jgi:hypothetical protein
MQPVNLLARRSTHEELLEADHVRNIALAADAAHARVTSGASTIPQVAPSSSVRSLHSGTSLRNLGTEYDSENHLESELTLSLAHASGLDLVTTTTSRQANCSDTTCT